MTILFICLELSSDELGPLAQVDLVPAHDRVKIRPPRNLFCERLCVSSESQWKNRKRDSRIFNRNILDGTFTCYYSASFV